MTIYERDTFKRELSSFINQRNEYLLVSFQTEHLEKRMYICILDKCKQIILKWIVPVDYLACFYCAVQDSSSFSEYQNILRNSWDVMS